MTSPGAIPKRLATLRRNVKRYILPPRRRRSYPRVVKIKLSQYPRKKTAPKKAPRKKDARKKDARKLK